MPKPFVICGALDHELSVGGPDVCPSCDCDAFGIETVKRRGQIICELRARLAMTEQLNWVDIALARRLSELIAENSRLWPGPLLSHHQWR